MWPSWPSLMGSIHITDTSKVSTMHNTPHESPPYSGYAQIKPSVKEGNLGLGRIIFTGPVVDGEYPLGGGEVSSQRLLIEDALQPRALPLCSQDHVRHCNGCTHCSHILLNSIKPFYTGSPLRAGAPPAYFTGGGRRSPLTGRPGRPFEPVDATAINYVSDGSLHCLCVGAKRNPICRRFLRRQAGSMVPR